MKNTTIAKKSTNSLKKKFLLVETAYSLNDGIIHEHFDESKFEEINEINADKSVAQIAIEEKPSAVFMADNESTPLEKFFNRLKNQFSKEIIANGQSNLDTRPLVRQPPESLPYKKMDQILDSYRITLSNLFPKVLKSVEIDIGVNRSSALLPTYLFGIDIFELIKIQLKKYQLLIGISEINISTTVELDVVNQIIDFKLKNSSSASWATMFSKNVFPALAKKIHKVEGTVSGFQQHNLSKDTICFTVIFVHNKILEKSHRDIQAEYPSFSITKLPMEL